CHCGDFGGIHAAILRARPIPAPREERPDGPDRPSCPHGDNGRHAVEHSRHGENRRRTPPSRRFRSMVSPITRARAALGAMALATAGLVTTTPAAHSQILPISCADGWQSDTVVEGVGNLENLDSDGAGGFYVTGIADGYLGHVSTDGTVEKLVTDLDHPAGVRVAEGAVHV